ncbi:MAG: hypothetical protein LDL41_16290 [Coleofasciculus sp. S288]|nr:hypothetical protein [Coleofasciculus sp. S288]
MEQVLKSAILSGALFIGLLVGFPVGCMTRNFQATPTGEDVVLPPGNTTKLHSHNSREIY